MSPMIEVQIDSVRVSLMSQQRVVILRQKDMERYLPIWVGASEAESITVALQEVEVARPLTHDLLKNILALVGARLLRVEIVSLKGDIFYGNLVLEHDGKTESMDTRPSDAIALAVRTHAPIFVNQDVMDEDSIVPEKDIQEREMSELETPEIQEPSLEASPQEDQRLDVFEDFLKKLGHESDEPPGEV